MLDIISDHENSELSIIQMKTVDLEAAILTINLASLESTNVVVKKTSDNYKSHTNKWIIHNIGGTFECLQFTNVKILHNSIIF